MQVLIFDLEDWSHDLEPKPAKWVRSPRHADITTRRVLRMLDELAARPTFFAYGSLAQHFPGLIWEIAEAGHEIDMLLFDELRLRGLDEAPLETWCHLSDWKSGQHRR